MAKLGVITVHTGQNFGASLQAYALVEKLRQMGNDAYLIDYYNQKIEKRMMGYSQFKKGMNVYSIVSNLKLLTSDLLYGRRKHTEKVKMRFDEFHNLILDNSHPYIKSSTELAVLNEEYDGFVCGSDQIWNPKITDLDGAFFLDFAFKNKKRIAYAPSIGMPSEAIDEENREKMKHSITNLQSISIREANNKELIEMLSGRECEVVVDPVLLLTKDDWERVAERSDDICPNQPYAFYYPVVQQPELEKYAMNECRRRGIKLLNPRLVPAYAKLRGYSAVPNGVVGPLEFLKLLKNASIVFTNSFHGTVFSCMYGRELYIMRLKGEQSARNNRYIEFLKVIEKYNESMGDCIHIDAMSSEDFLVHIGAVQEKSVNYLHRVLM